MASRPVLPAHRQHPRRFGKFRFVYPVLSRRAHGISIGINTNPDRVCNFDCVYCQVDRTTPPPASKFDLAVAEQELQEMIELAQSGELRRFPPFNSAPRRLLRLNDIALSGDAEPTMLRNFSEVVEMVLRHKPPGVKLVLMTNGAGLHRADVQRGLAIMDSNEGEIWVKLDAGTERYYTLVNRSKVPFSRILRNITRTARRRPIVVQSLFVKLRGAGPSPEEIGVYCRRLRDIIAAGGSIRLVQVCTIARKPMATVDTQPAARVIAPLAAAEVDAIAVRVREETGLAVESFYGDSLLRRTLSQALNSTQLQ